MRAAKLETVAAHGTLPAQDVVALGPGLELHGVRMRFERNEEIFGEEEPADYVYRVI